MTPVWGPPATVSPLVPFLGITSCPTEDSFSEVWRRLEWGCRGPDCLPQGRWPGPAASGAGCLPVLVPSPFQGPCLRCLCHPRPHMQPAGFPICCGAFLTPSPAPQGAPGTLMAPPAAPPQTPPCLGGQCAWVAPATAPGASAEAHPACASAPTANAGRGAQRRAGRRPGDAPPGHEGRYFCEVHLQHTSVNFLYLFIHSENLHC